MEQNMGLGQRIASFLGIGRVRGPPDMYSPDALGSMGIAVTGALPYGMPPVRGSRELAFAGKREPWLFAVTDKIARSVAAVSWNLSVARDQSGAPSPSMSRYYQRSRRQIFSTYGDSALRRARHIRDLKREANLEPVYEHPLLDMLDRPNPLQTGHQFRALLQRHMDLSGEIFCVKERNAFGIPIQLYPIPNFWCKLTPYSDRNSFLFAYGTFMKEILDTEVLWLKHLDLENPYARGMGPGFALADVIETYAYALKTEKAFYFNQGMPPVVLGLEGAKDEQLKQISEGWKEKYSGWQNAMKLAWVNFKVTVAKLGPKFADAQMLQQQDQKRDTIIQIYGVPPEILGITKNSNKATAVAAKSIYAEEVLVPRLEDMREMWQVQLVPEYGDEFVLEYTSPVPDDREQDIDVLKSVPTVLTVNEWRGLANFDPVDGPIGDQLYLLPAEGGGQETPMPAPPAPPAPDEQQKTLPARHQTLLIARGSDSDLDPEQIDSIIAALDSAGTLDQMSGVLSDCIAEFGTSVLDQIRASYKGGKPLPEAFNTSSDGVTDYLSAFGGDRIQDIDDTTKDYLGRYLGSMYDQGASIDDMVDGLMADSNFAFGEARAANIARTEVLGASNYGIYDSYQQSGVVQKKGWMATPGTKGSRESHEELDGTEIDLNQNFVDNATGAKGLHPGGFDDPGSDCNCRCTMYAVVDDPEKSLRVHVKEPHPTIVGRRAPYEVKANKKAVKSLTAQRDAVIAKLRKAKK